MKKKKTKKLSTTILRYIVVLATFAVLISVLGSLAGILQIRDETLDKIDEIKEEKKAGNKEELDNKIKAEIKSDSSDYALQYNEKFKQLINSIGLCRNYISNLYLHPEEGGKSEVLTRDQVEPWSYSHLMYSMVKDIQYEDVKDDIELLSGVTNLFQSVEYNVLAASVYFANDEGLMVSLDDNTNERIAEMVDKDDTIHFNEYDPREREWYKAAKESEGGYVFSETYRDVGGGNVITCSMAVYANDDFVGVIAIDFSYDMLKSSIVANSEREYEEFSKVIIENGKTVVEAQDNFEFKYVNIIEDERFSKFTDKLLTYEEIAYSDEDADTIYKNLKQEEIVINGKTYICTGYNIMYTNMYYVMFVEKGQASEAFYESLENQIKPFKEMDNKIDDIISTMIKSFIILMIFILFIVIVLSKIIAGKITKPINKLIDDVKVIGDGNLSHKVNINTNEELETLGNVFNKMTESLTEYMENLKKATIEQERISAELNVASAIQSNMLPKDEGIFEDELSFDVFATMKPAKEVGGDYYDYFVLDDRYVVTVIADVSGKGVPAALFMMMGKTLMRSQTSYLRNPAEIMQKVNNLLNENNDEMMFITSFMGILDIVTGEFVFANAGHNPPLIYSAKEDKYTYLECSPDLVLAAMPDIEYTKNTIKFVPGDKIFLYTDGVTEAMNDKNELYGEERLENYINSESIRKLSSNDIVKKIKKELNNFANGAQQADDITMLSLSFNQYKVIGERMGD